jgi:DNA-binding XRE family transcriptional regulator
MLRALPLTNKSKPGGRPRSSRAPRNAFRDWLGSCGMTPQDVATKLEVKISSIYNAANGYYKPGRDLAVKIAKLTDDAVPVDSWVTAKVRARKKG